MTIPFRQAWDIRSAQAEETLKSLKEHIRSLDKQIDAVLARVVEASNPTVIRAYEGKIEALERDKLKLGEQLHNSTAPRGTFDDFIELSLKFLANPYKLWESGNITLRRTLLRLVFSERIAYCRNEGYRTPKITLPFKALGVFGQGSSGMVQLSGEFSNSSTLPQLLNQLEDWEVILKGEPEVIHKLQALEEAATDGDVGQPKGQRRDTQAGTPSLPGPSL